MRSGSVPVETSKKKIDVSIKKCSSFPQQSLPKICPPFFATFHFEIIVDLLKSFKKSRESCSAPNYPQPTSPLMASRVSLVQLPKTGSGLDVLLTKLQTFFRFHQSLPAVSEILPHVQVNWTIATIKIQILPTPKQTRGAIPLKSLLPKKSQLWESLICSSL